MPTREAAVMRDRDLFTAAAWRPLPPLAPDAPNPPGAFVTLVSGAEYVGPALCLFAQLRRVRSRFPLIIVRDDRPGRALPQKSTRQLERAVGRRAVMPLSSLVGAAARSNVTSPRPLDDDWPPPLLKLWLWAMPVTARIRRYAFLDTDLLLRDDVDALLAHPFAEPLAAVAHMPCDPRVFNTGVLVFKPSARELRQLLHYTPHGRLVGLARQCEGEWTDQTVINAVFRKRCRLAALMPRPGTEYPLSQRLPRQVAPATTRLQCQHAAVRATRACRILGRRARACIPPFWRAKAVGGYGIGGRGCERRRKAAPRVARRVHQRQ